MMKTFTTKLLNTLILVSVLFSLNSSEALAQVTFPSYSPTAASSVAVCSGEETLIIDFTVAQATSNGIEVKVKLADGIEYVSGSAVITATQGNAVAVAQTNIANLNEPVFTVTSADGNNEVEVGTIVKLTIKRRAVCTAWNNAITAAETGFVFKDKMTVTIDGHSDSKESNTYSVSYPNLTINQPAPQSNKQIGETITREFTITNGSQNPTGTVYLSIEYPDEAYLTGTGAMTLQARLGTSGAYVDLTPTATNGKVRSYTLSGTLLGSDALLTNGEIIYLKETFKLKTCAPLTTYRLGWGCSADQQCEIKTTTAVITMAAGVANITDYTVTGPNYNDASFSTCNPFELTFTCKNTGTGGTMGAAYDLKLIGKTDYYRPRKFTMHQFVEIKTLTGTIVPNNITDGMELDLRFENKFNFDPDGAGVGLDDIDGDGYYDDLPVGATLTLKYKVNLICDAFTECSNKKEISDRGLITKVLHRTACDKTSWVEPAVYHSTSSAHMFLTREKVVDASYIPINIEKNKPFDMKIMTTYYSIVSSYNREGANANPNSRYVIEIDIPAGLTMPADADIKWTKISREEAIDGATIYGTPTTLPAGNITRTSDKITIVSPDNKIGFVTLHGVKFDCTNNSTMSVSYRFYEVFNYLNYPTCICPSVPLMCGTFTRNVLGCAPPCSNGPQTGIPVVEREDNSLGWTDYTMTARQSRNNISSYDLAKAIYMDEIRLTASAVQHGAASSLGARFVLKLGRSNTRTLEPLSADITITRNGVQIVSVTGHTVSLSKHASENQQIDWDFTSILPAQGLLDGDKIDVITRYRVYTEYGYYVDTQMGREWFLYNSGTNTVPIWNTANPITCLRLVPETYIMSTYAINGTNPHTISGCSSIDIGTVSNNYARRFRPGALPYTNEYRPGAKIKNVYIKI
ncbi:hypothetical protein, partial [Porphyromonas loveana]|uniref:hypothetical protein n=1 Tax=Porphyromonas loveana TaxID=1884669 RepID=UPI0035A19153